MQKKKTGFWYYAMKASSLFGSVWGFGGALFFIAAWALSGPVFGFSETWQLVMNTFTGIITFLMVFLIQNTQNRDTKATQLKLDELIRTKKQARNTLIDLENLSDDDLEEFQKQFTAVYRREVKNRHKERTK